MPYLASLGVSHLHLSPVLESVPGSTHGYDVVDHARVRVNWAARRPRALARTAREHGLGLVVDIVPNHMAMAPRHNHALWEVLREGPESPYARWFDIHWDAGGGRLLLPVLGGRLGVEIDHLKVDGDVLRYYDHVFPLREGTAGLPLPELLDAQWYRPAWWRLARTDLNYRRFFSISELIGVRVEDPEVFAATHAKILELLDEGVVEGLRIDHPTAWRTPTPICAASTRRPAGAGRWSRRSSRTASRRPPPGPSRAPRATTPCGTSTASSRTRRRRTSASTGGSRPPRPIGAAAGRVRRGAPGGVQGDHARAGHGVRPPHARGEPTVRQLPDPEPRDHAPWALGTALRELLVRVEVYRPYPSTDASLVVTEEAAEEARAVFTVPEEAHAVDVVRDLLLGRAGDGPEHAEFRARFAQTSSALRAKSVEDTAFDPMVPAVGQRGGRQPGRSGRVPGGLPRLLRARAARLARHRHRPVHARHQTQRRCPRRPRCSPSAPSGGRTCWPR